MIFIVYVLIAAAALAMVYFGHLQGSSQFYMSVFSAAIIGYCVYLDYKNRRDKKDEEKKKSSAGKSKTKHSAASGNGNIGKIARKSTKDKDLNK